MELDLRQTEFCDSMRPYLQKLGMSSSVAEAHGVFCGILCGASSEQKKQKRLWLSLLDLDVDEADLLAQEAIDIVDGFYLASQTALADSNLKFQLAIEEQATLAERLDDFSAWVQGFLYGLGLSHPQGFSEHSEQVQEFMQDLMQLSQAQDYDLEDEDEDEHALFELEEYVRVGVLLIFEELNPIAATPIQVPSDDNLMH